MKSLVLTLALTNLAAALPQGGPTATAPLNFPGLDQIAQGLGFDPASATAVPGLGKCQTSQKGRLCFSDLGFSFGVPLGPQSDSSRDGSSRDGSRDSSRDGSRDSFYPREGRDYPREGSSRDGYSPREGAPRDGGYPRDGYPRESSSRDGYTPRDSAPRDSFPSFPGFFSGGYRDSASPRATPSTPGAPGASATPGFLNELSEGVKDGLDSLDTALGGIPSTIGEYLGGFGLDWWRFGRRGGSSGYRGDGSLAGPRATYSAASNVNPTPTGYPTFDRGDRAYPSPTSYPAFDRGDRAYPSPTSYPAFDRGDRGYPVAKESKGYPVPKGSYPDSKEYSQPKGFSQPQPQSYSDPRYYSPDSKGSYPIPKASYPPSNPYAVPNYPAPYYQGSYGPAPKGQPAPRAYGNTPLAYGPNSLAGPAGPAGPALNLPAAPKPAGLTGPVIPNAIASPKSVADPMTGESLAAPLPEITATSAVVPAAVSSATTTSISLSPAELIPGALSSTTSTVRGLPSTTVPRPSTRTA